MYIAQPIFHILCIPNSVEKVAKRLKTNRPLGNNSSKLVTLFLIRSHTSFLTYVPISRLLVCVYDTLSASKSIDMVLFVFSFLLIGFALFFCFFQIAFPDFPKEVTK
jgi:hypothetical protein